MLSDNIVLSQSYQLITRRYQLITRFNQVTTITPCYQLNRMLSANGESYFFLLENSTCSINFHLYGSKESTNFDFSNEQQFANLLQSLTACAAIGKLKIYPIRTDNGKPLERQT
jgi:hypothetical protein